LPGNLPQQLTSFVGREREISELKRTLESARLVSLVGAGGSGKTRLSLEVARSLLSRFPDGVWFVELAALSDPELVPQAVAATLGIREESGRSLMAVLLDYLKPLKLLLVIDNCEHLIRACASFANTLLRAAPELHILATSREALDVPGEIPWQVLPLSLPDSEDLLPVESLAGYEAVKLFIDRARYTRPGFSITPENAPVIARLCNRLDGLPLAIELAAARMSVLTVDQIEARLDARFRLLTSGSRSALPRQQTLQALLDWSYDLLSEEEREMLRALSVFAGGSTLEAIRVVCTGSGDESGADRADEYTLIDLLSHLVQKSLVMANEYGSEVRYRMLDTIRQYAWEKRESEDGPGARLGRHRDWYLQLAETAQPELTGEDQETWLDRLEIEHDNLRAALDWSIKGDHNAEAALRLSAALWRFWDTRGYITEGRRWLRESLGLDGESELSPLVRAGAVSAAGNLALEQGEYELARALHNEALALRRDAGDKHGIANSLNNLGVLARRLGEYDRAAQFEEECLAIFRELDLKNSVASVLTNLGFVEQCRANYERAQALGTEALELLRETGDTLGIVIALNNLGDLARFQERYERATELYDQAMGLARALGDPLSIVGLLNNLGAVANRRGDYRRATELYLESLFKCKKLVHKQGIAECFEGLATAEMRGGRERSAQLFGAAESLRETILTPLPPPEQGFYQANVATLRAALGEKTFVTAWARGRAMQLDEAVEFATEGAAGAPGKAPGTGSTLASPTTGQAGENNPAGLTRREIEVLRLAASGLKATQIAGDLGLSDRTVNAHLHSVYSKIGVTSRAAATRFAIEYKLI
jgi:predicted ATPase/DNA-binding CsgD family transcriptional regulator